MGHVPGCEREALLCLGSSWDAGVYMSSERGLLQVHRCLYMDRLSISLKNTKYTTISIRPITDPVGYILTPYICGGRAGFKTCGVAV